MRASEIITEGLSSVLYHMTSTNGMASIANMNSFRLTPMIGNKSEELLNTPGDNKKLKLGDIVTIENGQEQFKVTGWYDNDYPVLTSVTTGKNGRYYTPGDIKKVDNSLKKKKNLYYMSFARNKTSSYIYPSDANSAAKIIVDGRKLMAAGYTGKAVDYWNNSAIHRDEMEDRILSTKPYIPNANKYVIAVHVLMTISNRDKHALKNDQRNAREIAIWAKKNGIPFYLHTREKTFDQLKKVKSDLSLLSIDGKRKFHPASRYGNNIETFDPYTELLAVDIWEKLSDAAKNKYKKLRSIDGTRPLAADIHNSKTDRRLRPELDKFIKHMTSRNIFNLDDLRTYVLDKFYEDKR